MYTRVIQHLQIIFPFCSLPNIREYMCEKGRVSCSVISESLQPHGLYPARLLCPWNSLVKNTGMGSVQFSRSVVSASLRPHESQHARPPCPSPTPGVYSNSHPLSRWCHPTISSSVVPFSSCPQSFPASGSFPMSQLFTWGGQSTGVSASASVLPMNTQDWSFTCIWLKFPPHHRSSASIWKGEMIPLFHVSCNPWESCMETQQLHSLTF